jgi:MFS family permease
LAAQLTASQETREEFMMAAAPSAPLTAAQEWRVNWPLVLSAMVGLSFGTVPSASLGLFIAPLEHEFKWSRTEISAGLTIFAFVSLPLTPFAGVLVDKFGPRHIAIPGLLFGGLSFAAFSLLNGSLVLWFAIWVAYTIASLLFRTLVWSTAVAGAYSASRGLALAVLLCGTAIATAVAPIVTHGLIHGFGWRSAYLGLGLGWGGVALVLTLLFFRDRRHARGQTGGDGAASAPPAPGGLTVREALRSLRMYRIALAIFLQSTMGVAILVHLVPMLTHIGISRAEAASIAALLGVASMIGKLVTGWLTDKVGGSLLPAACFAGPALSYLLLLQAPESVWLLSAIVMLLGYCSGASLQLATYLTSRYAGLRKFGTIFGLISTLMALSAGIGPVLAGAVFDATGSYSVLLMGGIPAALIAGIAVFGLGPYPQFAAVTPDSRRSEAPA